ncbi:DUF4340 domain-containing protein [Kordiimonas pumila]|uniref:DUF4340 domain-containing protein n=1 Tax=Kordiimonas pumila TaxID=2161677 RepID=A0ABV7D0Z9_9PROT|nr:DUF4340 domain-containing protein [Kordiimonas pumila]
MTAKNFMSERITNILGYATLVAIMAAIWIMFGEDPALDQGGRGEPTFEGLVDKINDTTTVTLKQAGTTTTLVKDGAVWRVQERGGYPAETETVTAFLKGLALSKRREPKTSNADRYDVLGLAAEAVSISLQSSDNKDFLHFKMGKRASNASGRSLTYIVQETDTRSWLVTGLEDASADPATWLDKTLLSIDDARVRDVSLGGVWLTRKQGESDYKVQGLRAGEEAAATWKLSEPARVITSLSFDDVKELANPLVDPAGVVELSTYYGLVLSLKLFDMGGSLYVQVLASADTSAHKQGAGTVDDMPVVDAAAEAGAINHKTRGWVYRLSSADSDILSRSRADFIVEKTE